MPWIPTRPLADSSGWRPAAALMALTLLTATEPGLAAPLNQVERCDGGGLGQGVLRSGPVPQRGGSADQHCRPWHQSRGHPAQRHGRGNDRTFTRRKSDDVRSTDDTSAANPAILNLMIGDYFYSKRRQPIMISLRHEAYSGISR